MMGVWNARLLDDSLHKALYGRGKALYQSTHHYKDFGLLDWNSASNWVSYPLHPECETLAPQGGDHGQRVSRRSCRGGL